MKMQATVLGYENKLYLNKAKMQCVLQCILWGFGCSVLGNKAQKHKETTHREAQ